MVASGANPDWHPSAQTQRSADQSVPLALGRKRDFGAKGTWEGAMEELILSAATNELVTQTNRLLRALRERRFGEALAAIEDLANLLKGLRREIRFQMRGREP